MVFFRILSLLLLYFIKLASSYAELTIEVTGGTESALPVAIVPFASPPTPEDLSAIIHTDLQRSGYFKMMAQQSMPSTPSNSQEVNFKEWQSLGQN